MNRAPILILALMLLVLVASGLQEQVAAAPAIQLTSFPTPTPGPDGRIIYIVQPGDTLWRVAAVSGVKLDELIGLNGLDPQNPVVVVGQELLLGLGGPAEVNPTPGPTGTPTPRLPTPSAQPGMGSICVLLFEDRNGDAFRQEDEPPIAGGAVSISNRVGTVSRTGTTSARLDEDGEVMRDCFEQFPDGEYNVTVAIPGGYNPTTELNYTLSLRAGDETLLGFGVQKNSLTQAQTPPPEEGGRSPMLGILGTIFLLVGIVLGVFASRMRRRGFL